MSTEIWANSVHSTSAQRPTLRSHVVRFASQTTTCDRVWTELEIVGQEAVFGATCMCGRLEALRASGSQNGTLKITPAEHRAADTVRLRGNRRPSVTNCRSTWLTLLAGPCNLPTVGLSCVFQLWTCSLFRKRCIVCMSRRAALLKISIGYLLDFKSAFRGFILQSISKRYLSDLTSLSTSGLLFTKIWIVINWHYTATWSKLKNSR